MIREPNRRSYVGIIRSCENIVWKMEDVTKHYKHNWSWLNATFMNVSEWSLWMRQQTPFWNEWHCEVWTLLLVKGRLQEIHCGQFLVLSLLCLVACWANNTFYTVEKTQVIEVCDQFSQTRKTTVPVVKQYRRLQGGKPWVKPALSWWLDWGPGLRYSSGEKNSVSNFFWDRFCNKNER